MKEIRTGNWAILGEDRIRRWPSQIGEKRPLRVTVSSWVGISPGAKHVNVQVKEDDNMWWSETENAWVTIYDDTESSGYSLEAAVMSVDEAVKVAKAFVNMVAGPKRINHIVLWDGIGKPKWCDA